MKEFTIKKRGQDKRTERRKLLGVISIGSTAIWHKPMITTIMLPAHAQTSTGVITTSSEVSNIAIPDQAAITIDVPLSHPNAAPPTISQVVLALNIEHPFQGDISVSLTSPSGVTSMLLDRIGSGNTPFGCTGDDFQLVLDDTVGTQLPVNLSDCPAGSLVGTFATGGRLTVFNDLEANGIWVLTINDAAGNDSGLLVRAELSISCE